MKGTCQLFNKDDSQELPHFCFYPIGQELRRPQWTAKEAGEYILYSGYPCAQLSFLLLGAKWSMHSREQQAVTATFLYLSTSFLRCHHQTSSNALLAWKALHAHVQDNPGKGMVFS